MVGQKEPHLKFKSSSKTKSMPSTKPKSSMELKENKEPKSLGFYTLSKNRPRLSQFKPTLRTSKHLKEIEKKKSTKDKTPSLVGENSKSSKNVKEQVEFDDSDSSHSS